MLKDPFNIERDGQHYKSGKMVGGYVPRQLAEYVHLLALYHNQTAQTVLRQIIEYWLAEQEPQNSILIALADRAYTEWLRRCRESVKDPEWKGLRERAKQFTRYKKEIRDRLQKRKIADEHIEKILQELHRLRKAGQIDEVL